MSRSRLLLIIPFLTCSAYAQDETLSSRYERQMHLFDAGASSYSEARELAGFIQTDADKKSVGLAALYSLLLPGMGELYAENFSSGKYFMIADGVLWLTFATFEVAGNAIQDDSRAFAASRARVDPVGKDEQYYVDIGNFLNIDEYNQKQLRDREPENLYDPAAGYAWEWDSDNSRASYREQRVNSDQMFNNKKFVVAALLVNRVASAINAVRSVISHNNSIDEALGGMSVNAEVMGGFSSPHGILFTLRRTF